MENFCKHCGSKIDSGALFCAMCGKPVTEQAQAPNTTRQMKPTTVIILVLIGVIVVGCVAYRLVNGGDSSSGAPAKVNEPTAYILTYEITSNHSWVDITYNNAYGDTEQIAPQSAPWTFDIEIDKGSGYFAYVSVQDDSGEGSAKVTCRILLNGVEVRKSESKGAYTIATCSGRVD